MVEPLQSTTRRLPTNTATWPLDALIPRRHITAKTGDSAIRAWYYTRPEDQPALTEAFTCWLHRVYLTPHIRPVFGPALLRDSAQYLHAHLQLARPTPTCLCTNMAIIRSGKAKLHNMALHHADPGPSSSHTQTGQSSTRHRQPSRPWSSRRHHRLRRQRSVRSHITPGCLPRGIPAPVIARWSHQEKCRQKDSSTHYGIGQRTQ